MDGFEKIAEEKIREAMEKGEFDNLPGAGKPLEGLEAYFAAPEHLRIGYSVLKSAGVAPEEVSLRREMFALRDRLPGIADQAERSRIERALRELELKYELIMDRFRRSRR